MKGYTALMTPIAANLYLWPSGLPIKGEFPGQFSAHLAGHLPSARAGPNAGNTTSPAERIL
jgi:hypothetical protein